MAKRDNHYEAAFEEYLRARRTPYVAVDEKRRALLGDSSVKSLDFIVGASEGGSWLVDVKGRLFPSGDEQKQYWKNWSTQDDLRSLAHWQRIFGEGAQALFVFAYHVLGERAPLPREQLYEHDERLYAFIAVKLDHYAFHARPISPAWDTVAMPVEQFRRHACALDCLL